MEGEESAKAGKDPGIHTKSTLFIRNLPYNCTSQDLEKCFGEWGPIRSAFPVRRKEQNLSEKEQKDYNGIGFVHFALAEDANKALERVRAGVEFMGRTILCELALRKHVSKSEILLKKRKNVAEDPKALKKVKVYRETVKSPVLIIEIGSNDKAIDYDKKQLYKRLRKSGQLREIVFPYEHVNQAKLIFGSIHEAEMAYDKINNHVFRGHLIRIIAVNDPNASMKQHRLIVRNLPFTVTPAKLEAIFGQFGKIKEVIVPTKGNNRELSRGFAFVQFHERFSAEKAMEDLNGKQMLGRIVAIDLAVNKTVFEKLQTEETEHQANKDVEAENEPVDVEGSDEATQLTACNEEIDLENVSQSSESEISNNGQNDDSELSKTVFIRNVPFSTDEDELTNALSKFGQLEYCKIVRDIETGAAKGTAFAKFVRNRDAQAAIEASRLITQNQLDINNSSRQELTDEFERTLTTVETKLEELAKRRTGKPFKSIMDTISSMEEGQHHPDESKCIILDGRALSIMPAIDRKQAKNLKKESIFLDSGPQDRRNLYLLNEILLKPKTELAKKFWPLVDISHRDAVLKERRKELKNNPNLLVSTTRLSLRHLPVSITKAEIKKVIYTAAKRALLINNNDEGYPIVDDRLLASVPQNSRPYLRQVKIVKDPARQRSKGYGFAEFSIYQHALLAVRYLANYGPGLWKELCPDRFTPIRHKPNHLVFRAKAPVVDFAIEKKLVLEKRQERLERQRNIDK